MSYASRKHHPYQRLTGVSQLRANCSWRFPSQSGDLLARQPVIEKGCDGALPRRKSAEQPQDILLFFGEDAQIIVGGRLVGNSIQLGHLATSSAGLLHISADRDGANPGGGIADGFPLVPCQDHGFLRGIFGIGPARSHRDQQDNRPAEPLVEERDEAVLGQLPVSAGMRAPFARVLGCQMTPKRRLGDAPSSVDRPYRPQNTDPAPQA